jgi:hypothetical protein
MSINNVIWNASFFFFFFYDPEYARQFPAVLQITETTEYVFQYWNVRSFRFAYEE